MPDISPELTEEQAKFFPEVGLDHIVLSGLKKGKLITAIQVEEEGHTKTVHYDIHHLKILMKEIYEVYSKKGSKKDFINVIEKRTKKRWDDIDDFMEKVRGIEDDDVFEVIDRKETKTGLTIKFQKVDIKEKKKIIKSIISELVKKITKEQLAVIFEQSVKRLNDMPQLKKVEKALKTKNPKIEGKRGCYKLVIDNVDLMLVA